MKRIIPLLLLATAAAAQTPPANTACLPAGASTRVTMGTFTADDGTTPAVPSSITYQLYVAKSQFRPRQQVVAPVTIPGASSAVVTLPSSATAITDASLSEVRAVFAWEWTWPGSCGGAPCKGNKWQELRFCRPPA